MNPKERDDRLVLAASRGVLEGFGSGLELAGAIGKYRYGARTFEGDAFETAFLWARQEREDRIETQGASAVEIGTPLRAPALHATILLLFREAENRFKKELADAKLGTPGEYSAQGALIALELCHALVAKAFGPKALEPWTRPGGRELLRMGDAEGKAIPILRAGYDRALNVWWAALEVEREEKTAAGEDSTWRGASGQTKPGKSLDEMLASLIGLLVKKLGARPWAETHWPLSKGAATVEDVGTGNMPTDEDRPRYGSPAWLPMLEELKAQKAKRDAVWAEMQRHREVHGIDGYYRGLEKALEMFGFEVEQPVKTTLVPFTCPKCGRVSHNPNDAANKFCGVCGFAEGA